MPCSATARSARSTTSAAATRSPTASSPHKLLSLTGRDESYIEPVADRPGHDRRYSVTTSKVEALGWRPARGLDEALEATVAWYRENRWWWQPLKARAAFDRLPG